MRKRSTYRPKPIIRNPLNYALTSVTMVSAHESYLIDLRIKNHGALTAMMQGRADRKDIDVIIGMGNTCEALYRLGFGSEYGSVISTGIEAIYQIATRGIPTNRFIMRAQEISALNDLIELHDAQMEVITIRDMEKALAIVHRERAQKKMRSIVDTQRSNT